MKNILLIPTTDNIVTNWTETYEYFVEKGHNVYIINDNKLITKPLSKEFKKLDLYLMRLYQLEKLSFIQKIVLLSFLNIYAKYILKKYKIDIVIVSNDNPVVQNVFVNIANNMNINTILHQAAGIFKRPIKLSLLKKIKNKIMKKIFNFNPTGNIGTNVKKCFLQGTKWIDYIDNKNHEIIGNQYYYQLINLLENICNEDIALFKSKYQIKSKKIITFFSQPFKELRISSEHNIDKLYKDIEYLSNQIFSSDKFIFIFKPHPQEKYYKNFKIKGLIIEDELNTVLLASDITLTIFSTMAIQSKIVNKLTLGYLPNYISKEQTEQMKEVFDFYSSNINDLLNYINSNHYKENKNFNNIIDLNINTKEEVYKLLTEELA